MSLSNDIEALCQDLYSKYPHIPKPKLHAIVREWLTEVMEVAPQFSDEEEQMGITLVENRLRAKLENWNSC